MTENTYSNYAAHKHTHPHFLLLHTHTRHLPLILLLYVLKQKLKGMVGSAAVRRRFGDDERERARVHSLEYSINSIEQLHFFRRQE